MGSPGSPSGWSDPPPTRRDDPPPPPSVVPPTRRDPDELPDTDLGPALLRLPDALTGYQVIVPLPGGNEADVLHLRAPNGVECVVKVYRWGLSVDEEALQVLSSLPRDHLVVPILTGLVDGRRWELLEYLPAGSLADLIDTEPGPLSNDIPHVVRQLTDALDELHRAGIVHGDLKPANILLRTRDPLRLAVTDFGLSKYLGAASVRFTKRAFTVAYAAPESFVGTFSPAVDWWAVGIIVRQLATGAAPFAGLDERVIMNQVSMRNVPVDTVTDPRLRLLCQGLLTKDSEHRWGGPQIRRWLAGESPPVVEARSRAGARSIVIAGTVCWTRPGAARAMAAHWDTAEDTFLRRLGTAADPGEGWRLLRAWLDQFDEDVDARIQLIDRVLVKGDLPVAVRLLHLLRWLDPSLAPQYRGLRLAPSKVATLATAAAGEPRGRAAEVVGDLYSYQLLPVLAGFAGAQALVEVDTIWRRLVARLASVSRAPDLSVAVRAALAEHASTHHSMLLAAAAEPNIAQRWIEAAGENLTHVTDPPAWLASLTPPDDPVAALVVLAVVPVVEAEAQQRTAAREYGQLVWRQQQAQIAAGRPKAILYALAAAAIWGVVTVLVAGVTQELFPLRDPLTSRYDYFGGAWIVAAAAEIATASVLGGRYHPQSSAMGALVWLGRRLPDVWSLVRRAGNRIRATGGILVPLICVGCCLGPLVLTVAWLAAIVVGDVAVLAAAPAELVWTAVRVTRHRVDRRQRLRELMGDDGRDSVTGGDGHE